MAKKDKLLSEFERLVFNDLKKRKHGSKSQAKKSKGKSPSKRRPSNNENFTTRKTTRKGKSKSSTKNKKPIHKVSSGKRNRLSTEGINGLRFERKRTADSDKRAKPTILKIIFTKHSSFKKKVDLINSINEWIFEYFTGRVPFPIAIQTILTTKKRRDTFERASRFSDFDVHISNVYVKSFILNAMIAYQDNYIEYIEDPEEERESDWVYNPKNIHAITVKFIYYQKPVSRELDITSL